MAYVNSLNTGTDHAIWMKGMEFYRDELDIMGKRLLEVAGKNTNTEALKGIEHFQNQFFIQQKNIADLKHEVKNYLRSFSHDASLHEGHVDERFIKEGKDLKSRYELLEQIMNNLRHEFNLFLRNWM